MNSEWIKNIAATQRVKELLLKAGIPLEIFVSSICQTFADSNMKFIGEDLQEPWVSASRHVYKMDDQNSTLREIDQLVEITKTIELTENINLTLCTIALIECKHRDNVQIFGFPYPDQSFFRTCLPIISDLAARNFPNYDFIQELSRSRPNILKDIPLSSISFIEIVSGKTPNKVFEENLIYKAGSSLYDYILTVHRNTVHDIAMHIMNSLGIVEDADKFYRRVGLDIDKAIDNLPESKFLDFNSAFGRMTNLAIFNFIPILCMDSPIYSVDSTADEITGFSEKDVLLTDIVFSPWPGKLLEFSLTPHANPVVLVTNHNNIANLLENILQWHDSIENKIVAFSEVYKNDAMMIPLRSFIRRAYTRRIHPLHRVV